jgi:hypothetical protein
VKGTVLLGAYEELARQARPLGFNGRPPIHRHRAESHSQNRDHRPDN